MAGNDSMHIDSTSCTAIVLVPHLSSFAILQRAVQLAVLVGAAFRQLGVLVDAAYLPVAF